jgi:hypothetical protein
MSTSTTFIKKYYYYGKETCSASLIKKQTAQALLVTNVDPDSLGILCSYLHPEFQNYIFGKHDHFTIKDMFWFVKEYWDLKMLRKLWDKVPNGYSKLSLFGPILEKAIKNSKTSFVKFLCEHGSHVNTYHLLIAEKIGNHGILSYLRHRFHQHNRRL